ncbi:MAG TPA: hypothetical protein VGB22_04335 [candidate division Zixibacteria bacterium]|jgi:outer membrane protein assembly factor BamE (lipoprotein component of BamABCDE complex)
MVAMKRINWLGPGLLGCLIVLGCTSARNRDTNPTPRGEIAAAMQADSVVVGMRKDQVRQVWGDPASIENDSETPTVEVWKYDRPLGAGGTQSGGTALAVVPRAIYALRFDGDRVVSVDAKPY